VTEIEVLEDKVAIVGIGATPTGAHPGTSANELGMTAFKQSAKAWTGPLREGNVCDTPSIATATP
jgi:hypothetical protein